MRDWPAVASTYPPRSRDFAKIHLVLADKAAHRRSHEVLGIGALTWKVSVRRERKKGEREREGKVRAWVIRFRGKGPAISMCKQRGRASVVGRDGDAEAADGAEDSAAVAGAEASGWSASMVSI